MATTMLRRPFVDALKRRACNSSLIEVSPSSRNDRATSAALMAVSTVVAGTAFVAASSPPANLGTRRSAFGELPLLLLPAMTTTSCQFREDVIHVSNEDSEADRFEQCVAYHRCLLQDYKQRWTYSPEANKTPSKEIWPPHVPETHEVPALELDLSYCKRRKSGGQDRYCSDLQFRLASYYLRQDSPKIRRKGFKMVKKLAEMGHADGMCMYGIVLNEGKVVEADPTQATVWWQRAVDMHRHVASTYELAVAFYTGEGVVENEELAVYYFERAATLGHTGAAYMLGDCLLDGVGAPRDRAEALEWLVAAGELGHRSARSRVLAVLEKEDGANNGRYTDASRQTLVEDVAESSKWTDIDEGEQTPRLVSIERRFTIGGGSRNPVVLARRKTVVAESRMQ